MEILTKVHIKHTRDRSLSRCRKSEKNHQRRQNVQNVFRDEKAVFVGRLFQTFTTRSQRTIRALDLNILC